jgi:hypothetical protein
MHGVKSRIKKEEEKSHASMHPLPIIELLEFKGDVVDLHSCSSRAFLFAREEKDDYGP